MVRRAAGFNTDQTWRQLLEERQDIATLQLPANNHLSASVNAANLENRRGGVKTGRDVVVKCALPPRTDIVSRLTTSEKWLKAASNVSKTRTVLTSLKLAN
jgi:hypothetical protein